MTVVGMPESVANFSSAVRAFATINGVTEASEGHEAKETGREILTPRKEHILKGKRDGGEVR